MTDIAQEDALGNAYRTPQRIQRRRTKGWRMPESTVAVTRPGKFGNPFEVSQAAFADMDKAPQQAAVDLFEGWINEPDQMDLVADIKANLAGKNLACWCSLDKPCHADVLLKIANDGTSK